MTATATIVWKNGSIVPAATAVAANDRGFTLADGAFETMRMAYGELLFWARHRSRIAGGLKFLGLETGDWLERACAAAPALADAVGLGQADAVARLTVSRGVGARGLATAPDTTPTVILSVAPAKPALPGVFNLAAFHDLPRTTGPYATYKSPAAYGPNIAARRAAANAGCDDAVLFAPGGGAACASAANIIAVDEGGLARTPPLADGALPGVVRAVLLASGEVVEERVDAQRLASSWLLLTNVVLGVARAQLADGPSWNDAPVAASNAARRLSDVFRRALEDEVARAHASHAVRSRAGG